MYDIDDEKCRGQLELQDFIGQTEELLLSEIVRAPGGLTVPLVNRAGARAPGTITLTAEELRGANNEVHFTVQGTGLASLNWLGNSDPILVFHRAGQDGTCAAQLAFVQVFGRLFCSIFMDEGPKHEHKPVIVVQGSRCTRPSMLKTTRTPGALRPHSDLAVLNCVSRPRLKLAGLCPRWKPFVVSTKKLANNDPNRPILLEVLECGVK